MSAHQLPKIISGVLLVLALAGSTFLLSYGGNVRRINRDMERSSQQQNIEAMEPFSTNNKVAPTTKAPDATTQDDPSPPATPSLNPTQQDSRVPTEPKEKKLETKLAPVVVTLENPTLRKYVETPGSLPRNPVVKRSQYSAPRLESRQPPCDDSSTCSFKKGCVADEEGVCYKPDFEILHRELFAVKRNKNRKTSPSGGRHADGGGHVDLKCSWMPDEPSPLPKLSPWFQSLVESPPPPTGGKKTPKKGTQAKKGTQPPLNITEQVDAFKHFSGLAFGNQSWYDWDAPIKEVGPTEEFITRGRHVGPDEVYLLENFCFDSGSLAGFQANLDTWRGRDEMGYLHPNDPLRQGSDQLKWPVLRKLRFQPTWYIDRKLAILPMGTHWWHSHSSVAQMRTAGLIANIESAWPSEDPDQAALKPRDDVTIAFSANYAHPPAGPVSRMFQSMAGMSHIAVHARMKMVTKPNHGWPKFGFNQVCFKEAVYFQGCYNEECAKVNPPKSQIPLWGTHNPITQRFVARRFRACANAADDTVIQDRSRHIAPTVLVPQRSLGRDYLQGLQLLVRVHKSLISIFPPPAKPRIVAMEMSDLTVAQTINLYSNVDVIISTWNSGLMYGFLTGRVLLPKNAEENGGDGGEAKAVGLAIQLDSNRESHPRSGLNVNPSFDFGSQYVGMSSSVDIPLPAGRAANSAATTGGVRTFTRKGFDLEVHLPQAAFWRYVKRDWLETTYVPKHFFDRVVQTGLCLWKEKHQGVDNPKDDDSSGNRCSTMTKNTDALISKFQRDKNENNFLPGDGVAQDLRYEIRALVPEAKSREFPRLVSLYNSLLSGQLDELWERYSHSPGDPKRIAQGFADGPQLLLVMKSCPASWSDDSALPLSTELRVLLRALPSTVSLMFLFGSPCLWPETKEAIFSAWPTVGFRGKIVVPIPLHKNNNFAEKLYCGHTKRIEGHCLEMLRVRKRSHYKETKKLLLMVADEGVTLPEPLTKAITGTPVLWLGAKGKWRVEQGNEAPESG